MAQNKICFIICWFGKLPDYLPVWSKTCERNTEFDFLLITDDKWNFEYPPNVKCITFTRDMFLSRVIERVYSEPSLKEAYRLCDYRPMYGVIFKEELQGYDYWGYCDIDIVLGSVRTFLPVAEIYAYEAVFNGGHFTLIKNNAKMNELFKSKGSIFDYKTVIKKHAIFAFDETTGFQKIARANNIKAKFGIPYIETESKYNQLRSRLESHNPELQAYYWENGNLYRVKAEADNIYYQELAYIHLQKRKIRILDINVLRSNSFWVCPCGYKTKSPIGWPSIEEINAANPYEGEKSMSLQAKTYRNMKIKQILKRGPYQIYVRLMQQKAGINAGDGTREEMEWQRI